MHYSRKIFIILCLSGTALALPALAQDGEAPAVVQAMLDNFERQTQAEATYDSAEEDGDGNVTITNLVLTKKAAGEEPGFTLKLAEATLEDISEESDTLFKIGSASFSNLTTEIAGKDFAFTMAIPESSAEGWYVRSLGDNPTPLESMLASSSLAEKMTGGKMTITANGQSVTADGLETTWSGDPNTGSGTYAMTVTNIAIPESLIALADQGGMLKQLGYTSLSFDISGGGKTEMTGETVKYDVNFGIAGRDMAALKFNVNAGDIPLAVFAELQKAQAAGKEPDFAALMPQLQNITLAGMSFHFEDASLTSRLLPMLAAMQGMDEKTLIASAGPMLQLGLMQLQNEAFAKQASEAVNSFLNDPKSITITAAPAAPVKVSDIMAMNPNAPGEAITKLGVSVTAND